MNFLWNSKKYVELLDSSSLHFNHYLLSFTRFQIYLGTGKLRFVQESSSSEEEDAFWSVVLTRKCILSTTTNHAYEMRRQWMCRIWCKIHDARFTQPVVVLLVLVKLNLSTFLDILLHKMNSYHIFSHSNSSKKHLQWTRVYIGLYI